MANGDQGSFRQFYELTSGLVNSLALRILGNAADAEEIVVDVYSKAWRTAGSFNECRGTPLAWLLMMTRSLAIDRFRQRSSRPRATEDETRLALLASSDDDPETLTAGAEHRQIVRKALAKLSSEQQEVLRLAFYSGLSHSELATELGQPLGTVKTRIRLGLQHMKRLLEESN
ncbi:MAG: sigma-70 family RNA polymerase sigma factor [Bryobacterales bacterium]|nr:sigma-70 family RNA polymerase sigma factor [Bryobacterales bacterium]